MRKLIVTLLALQLSFAGLFASPYPLSLPSQKWRGETPPLPWERGLGGEGHGSLKILSWNIFMLPRVAANTGQEMRAKGIVDALRNSDYDVILFQEAFPKKIRAIIAEGLKEQFPYESGKPIKGGVTLFNGGVWVISKLPIKTRVDKLYRECDGTDCFANKGAMLIEVEKDGHTFQLVNTHLQADEGKDKQKVRNEQYYDLNKLLNENRKEGIPQIVAGDFNTPVKDTTRYAYMLNALKAEDGPLSGVQQFSWDNTLNDITKGKKDTSQVLLDYIFTRSNGFEFSNELRVIRRPQVRWSCTNQDLSDHFAVEGVFEY